MEFFALNYLTSFLLVDVFHIYIYDLGPGISIYPCSPFMVGHQGPPWSLTNYCSVFQRVHNLGRVKPGAWVPTVASTTSPSIT